MPTRAEVERALENSDVVLVLDDEGRKLAERPALPRAMTVTIVCLHDASRTSTVSRNGA